MSAWAVAPRPPPGPRSSAVVPLVPDLTDDGGHPDEHRHRLAGPRRRGGPPRSRPRPQPPGRLRAGRPRRDARRGSRSPPRSRDAARRGRGALADGGSARGAGATAYVTLEPCAHHGRTGPCTGALLRAGVTRVVYAVPDPTPRAAGGAEVLRDSGIEVTHQEHPASGALVADWTAAARAGRPVVVWKMATTLDGRVAAADGSSRWITSAEARADAHLLRATVGAVVVGTGTALRDDPSLTARTPQGELLPDQPLRVVVGRRDVPAGARLRSGAGELLHLRTHDPHEVLAELSRRGVHRVLLEGGPALAAAFWRAGCVDEVLVYLAPALLGAGPPGVGDLGIGSIEDAARLELRDVARVGPDLRLSLVPVSARPDRPAGPAPGHADPAPLGTDPAPTHATDRTLTPSSTS
ncbi:bifunctional diaminohydroxyphosphoribosylaminopyrimidine deaminase/5-amino-6-(5-phosphoribosylamino)uracil reductase RibD [Ornithinimicrobium sp. W1665]|uniref:bifunctional diaminohydroxyphosphoribosylaminopyrimidine deaminase/5-amino-6-(5-phosphoribosylamino)uracil reductase RibD n=1 Tax=Ornithinimicrobium sp. W1665 TaxID=3416666 RepID=UPI003D6BFDA0